MNVINGTITSIVPDGGYDSRNGPVYTFQMTIQTNGGEQITAQIGSKTQIYPIAVGQPIAVELTNTQHGPRFKKFNPQYAQQGQQQQQASQNPQQAPQQPAQGPNAPQGVSTGFETEIRSDLVCAMLRGGVPVDYNAVLELQRFIMTGKKLEGGAKRLDWSKEDIPPDPNYVADTGQDVPSGTKPFQG